MQERVLANSKITVLFEHETLGLTGDRVVQGANLVSSQRHAGWIEVHSFPIDRYTRRPLVVQDCMAIASDEPGIGVEFNWEMLEPYKKL
jgi:hypothetical protein